MRICLVNEDQAWFLEHDGGEPNRHDCRHHRHINPSRAIRELVDGTVRVARLNGSEIPGVVVRIREEKDAPPRTNDNMGDQGRVYEEFAISIHGRKVIQGGICK